MQIDGLIVGCMKPIETKILVGDGKIMKDAYGFVIRNGHSENHLCSSCNFIVFADTLDEANKFIEKKVKQFIEEDKYENDDGEIVNWWWKYHSVERVFLSTFDNSCVGVAWI